MTVSAWCFGEPGTAVEAVPLDTLEAHLADAECLLFVDCNNPTDEEIAFLADRLGIHDLTAEDLVNANQRTKLERFSDHYHVALHDLAFVGDELQNREVDVVLSDGWLLSVRHSESVAFGPPGIDALTRFERQRGEHGSNDEGFLLWAILDVIVDRYFEVTSVIDERLDDIEDVVFDRTPDVIPREIFTLRRSIVAFRRAVGPLREVLAQLLRKEVPCIGDPAIAHLQDVYDHTLRVLDLIEAQRELLTGLLEGQLAVQSNQMNRVMKATSSWGAILIASTLIAGIYGMNFEHMPELEWIYGYPFALGLMALTTIVLYRVFKRQKWL
ncbi:MAG: magnesium/cobalt transporter CorA [Acidimicrobiia bacterium]